MTNPKHDLNILFGDAEEPVEDLGVPLVAVEIAKGDTYYFTDWYEARAAIMGHPPKFMPRVSLERPIFWWFQPVPATTNWAVIQFTLAGEHQIAEFSRATAAYQHVLALRDKERKRQRELRALQRNNSLPKRLPQPPFRCICRMEFDTAQELLDHRCGPRAPTTTESPPNAKTDSNKD